jgi:hypothetical protein
MYLNFLKKDNHIDHKGSKEISDFLEINTTLKKLNLSSIYILTFR